MSRRVSLAVAMLSILGTSLSVASDAPAFVEIAAGLPGIVGGSGAWGDYDQDGDLDVLISGQDEAGHRLTRIYRNDGGSFVDIEADIPGVVFASVAWGDYDNDDDLDILINGEDAMEYARIYRNDDGDFVNIDADLPGGWRIATTWADYDNDGDLDVFLTEDGPGLYRNDGGVFVPVDAGLPPIQIGSADWGDCDNDGDLDLLLTGSGWFELYENQGGGLNRVSVGLGTGHQDWFRQSSADWGDYDGDGYLDILVSGLSGGVVEITLVYHNELVQFGGFVEITDGTMLPGLIACSSSWGDCDNDGDLDILIAGRDENGVGLTRIYRNDGGSFVDMEAGLTGSFVGSAAWGDYDADGDLDILLTGMADTTPITRIYENQALTPNTPPGPPANLTVDLSTNPVTINWDSASDAETPATGLTYNLRIGTTPGGMEIMSAMADIATGQRRIASLGNTNHNTSWPVYIQSAGPVYCSVQAVDASFAGSPFCNETVFSVTSVPDDIAARPACSIENHPNPFNPRTDIDFTLAEKGLVRIAVFDVLGQRVNVLADRTFDQGSHSLEWSGTDFSGQALPSGTYLVHLLAAGKQETRKVMLAR